MFLLDYGSFYERKTEHLQKCFLCERGRVQGDIYFGLSSVQKPFKHTTYERESNLQVQHSFQSQYQIRQRSKQIFYCPCKITSYSVCVSLRWGLFQQPKRRHHDTAKSRTQPFILFSYLEVFFVTKTSASECLKMLSRPEKRNNQTKVRSRKAWFIYTTTRSHVCLRGPPDNGSLSAIVTALLLQLIQALTFQPCLQRNAAQWRSR